MLFASAQNAASVRSSEGNLQSTQMSRIGICIYPLAGPINASRNLARELPAKGHEVFYIGIPDCERFLASMNMPFVPIFERRFPLGSTGPRTEAHSAKPAGQSPGRRTKNVAKEFYQAMMAARSPASTRC